MFKRAGMASSGAPLHTVLATINVIMAYSCRSCSAGQSFGGMLLAGAAGLFTLFVRMAKQRTASVKEP